MNTLVRQSVILNPAKIERFRPRFVLINFRTEAIWLPIFLLMPLSLLNFLVQLAPRFATSSASASELDQLRQISNLLSQEIRAMPSFDLVDIIVREEGKNFRLKISIV